MRVRTSLLAFCSILLISATHAHANFSALYVLGDSLSDTGNLASTRGDFPPPFFENRVSNGPVAVEILAALLGLRADASFHLIGEAQGTNYAVAGAKARGDGPIDLASQTGALLQHLGNEVPSDALVVVFIGGNDARDARDADDDMEAEEIIRQAVDAIAAAIEALANAGVANFLVSNVPDLGAIPESRLLALVGQPLLPDMATQRSEAFNVALVEAITSLRDELGMGVKIALFDFFGINQLILDNGAAFGLTNVDDACLLIINRNLIFDPDCDNGNNLNSFAFFDPIHPTAPMHERLGRFLHALAPVSPPMPPVVE